MTTLRIATRGSMLALWQANHIRDELIAREPSLSVELVVLKTRGDKILDRPLAEVGGKGLFVKEIEEALLDGRADIAVHSLKDLPADVPDALEIASVPERQDPRDALVLPAGSTGGSLSSLPRNARVGTSSLRRVCQLLALRPDLSIVALRGNVDTRLKKVDAGEFDAIILAAAGLRRLGHGARISASISVEESLPAIGQGALALECRRDDQATRTRLLALDHPATHFAVDAERAFLARLEGGCQTPMAAFATIASGRLTLDGMVGAVDGSQILRDRLEGPVAERVSLGRALAEKLLARGAEKLLAAVTP